MEKKPITTQLHNHLWNIIQTKTSTTSIKRNDKVQIKEAYAESPIVKSSTTKQQLWELCLQISLSNLNGKLVILTTTTTQRLTLVLY